MNKKWFFLALKLSISGGLIWLLLGSMDIESAKGKILSANPAALAGTIVVFYLQVLVIAARWTSVLLAMNSRLTYAKAINIAYIEVFFNQTLPSSAGGDAVRVYKSPFEKELGNFMILPIS